MRKATHERRQCTTGGHSNIHRICVRLFTGFNGAYVLWRQHKSHVRPTGPTSVERSGEGACTHTTECRYFAVIGGMRSRTAEKGPCRQERPPLQPEQVTYASTILTLIVLLVHAPTTSPSSEPVPTFASAVGSTVRIRICDTHIGH